MDPIVIGFISIAVAAGLIFAGMYVAVALALTSFVGAWLIRGDFDIASRLLAQAALDSIASYDLAVIPLFVLMGNLMTISDIGADTFKAANQIFRRITGGLGIATVAANALFAAVTGVTIASCAVFTKVAVPEMLRFGYTPRFATGIVAGSGLLGMLIPPSVLMVVFAIVTEAPIRQIFMAGFIPGLVLATLFAFAIVFMVKFMPEKAGVVRLPVDEELLSTWSVAKALGPIVTLIGATIGGIYAGWFTPTEAAAVGAAGALAFALARGKLSWLSMWRASVDTGHVTAAICLIVIAASMYSRMLAMSGVAAVIGDSLSGAHGFYMTVTFYVLLLLFLGMFLDSISTILLTVPIALPVFLQFDANVVWFGIVTILATEAGMITPPLGIAVFAVKSALGNQTIGIHEIFLGVVPFFLMTVLTVVLLVIFPQLVTVVLR
ncbi:TRAP transporter large permease [Chelatococcus asaccharovorans]|uniref:TRAP transporter large permease n=1 Tax=Chelatococcus asaccharovorans TaxID=28210 RepID=UPI00224C763A|nr:TRAP transporter large permease subunit [Chelatococcus asaccharovorans]CAH1666261.1 Tripartite ATP-independent transporter DctM subunit [Chelatococcus asaccharovorans]CAH1681563.1 Tripartite ATP-independent transporter DctM subunit [Chelatococcus asaccharovorans]